MHFSTKLVGIVVVVAGFGARLSVKCSAIRSSVGRVKPLRQVNEGFFVVFFFLAAATVRRKPRSLEPASVACSLLPVASLQLKAKPS